MMQTARKHAGWRARGQAMHRGAGERGANMWRHPAVSGRTTARRVTPLMLVALLGLSLAACSSGTGTASPTVPPISTPTRVAATPTVIVTPTTPATFVVTATTPSAASSVAPTATVLAGSSASPSGTAAVASSTNRENAAIMAVIQRANQEQVQAVTARDATVMKDTATTAYYAQVAQELNDLLGSGITAIQLVNLQWGPITLQGPSNAQATTIETWRTTLADGGTAQNTDTNVYILVLQGGAWKIQDDQHPTSRLQQPPGTPSASPVPAATIPPGGQGLSRNWAGYSATGGTYTAVAGNWTIPTVNPSVGPAGDATWVGIGGVTTNDLIQAGTDTTVQGGQVAYTAWVETLPQASKPVPLTVNAGDQMSVSITQQPDGTWQITMRDLTANGMYQTSVAYQSSRSSAEWIEESPTVGRRTLLRLDSFGTIQFSGATAVVNGQQQTAAQAGAQPITMYGSGGQPLAQTSALGADGASFSVTRTSAPAPRIAPRAG